MEKVKTLVLAAALVTFLSACSKDSDNATITRVIDEGLSKDASCYTLPIGVYSTKDDFGRYAFVLELLRKTGKIEPGPVQLSSGYVDQFKGESYNFTDSGKTLIHKASTTKPSGLATQPCVRFGKYQISSIEAVDVAVDANGQNIASVRARIVFKPEEWMVAGREDPRAARAWGYFAANEAAQWMYRLKKSGDSYFYTGPAGKL